MMVDAIVVLETNFANTISLSGSIEANENVEIMKVMKMFKMVQKVKLKQKRNDEHEENLKIDAHG